MSLLGTHKGRMVLGALMLAASSSAVVPKDMPSGSQFGFYLLALSLHPAYCRYRNQRMRECRAGGHPARVIHGLWPERLEPRTYPHDCPAPPLDLDDELERQLADFMPGMLDGLHEHEWREHGGCSGLDDDTYFRA